MKYLKYALLLTLLCSCQNENSEAFPEDIESILMDIHLANTAADLQPVGVRDSLYDVYLRKVEEIHELDSGETMRILQALKNDPQYYQELMYGVQTRIKDSLASN